MGLSGVFGQVGPVKPDPRARDFECTPNRQGIRTSSFLLVTCLGTIGSHIRPRGALATYRYGQRSFATSSLYSSLRCGQLKCAPVEWVIYGNGVRT